ncbi:hypothetical protein, conserved [Eimeria tenella]|uniref:Uncharacterized protein n=1 Tax=Eimeria tenella TaxID=5802 RepID=U6KV46_EIMTE|nr:hypothetical protein, conserved [Eimeria tenella]CDJ39380.1 hypothetical protein, conserved [Eimeria tenella]|eukprot:XP_013230135.1 hypothetical protein, conserved [Eimeria tenella]
MYDVADDLDRQREASYNAMLALIEKEEDARQAQKAQGPAAAAAAAAFRSSSAAAAAPALSPARWGPPDPQLDCEGPLGPPSAAVDSAAQILSLFEDKSKPQTPTSFSKLWGPTEAHELDPFEPFEGPLGAPEGPQQFTTKRKGTPWGPQGGPPGGPPGGPLGGPPGGPSLSSAIRALEGLAGCRQLRGEQLREDPRFATLLSILEANLRREVSSSSSSSSEDARSSNKGDTRCSGRDGPSSATRDNSSSSERNASSCSSNSQPSSSSSSSSNVSVEDLCSIARAVARLQLQVGTDNLLRSLVLLGMARAAEFGLFAAADFLLSLAAAATATYRPIQKTILKAFRKHWADAFLAAVAAVAAAAAARSSSSSSSSSGQRAPAGADLRRVLLLLLPLFAAHDALGEEMPVCLEALVSSGLWAAAAREAAAAAAAAAALGPGELVAAAATAAAAPQLQQNREFWADIRAAAKRHAQTLNPRDAITLCSILDQVGEDYTDVLLRSWQLLQEQLPLLPSSSVFTAASLAAAAAAKQPKLLQLLSLLRQQLLLRAANS